MLQRLYVFLLLPLLLGGGSSTLIAQLPAQAIDYTVEVFGTPAPGYIFLSPRSYKLLDDDPTNLMVMDSAGHLVWFAPLTEDEEAPFRVVPTTDFKLLKNGRMSFWDSKAPHLWNLLDSSFHIVDSVSCNGINITDEHEISVDENGHYFLICDTLEIRDASALVTRDSVTGSTNCVVEYQIIQEQDANGNTVFEWYSLDNSELDDVNPLHWSNPGFMDHTHANSIFVSDNDEVLISSRNINEITAYQRQTGQVLWRFGGESNQFTVLGDTAPIFFGSQHDANYAPNGNLYLFDNGRYGGYNIARYVEYELDTVNWTATLVREHRNPDNKASLFMGNALLLDNGHVIANWGSALSLDGTPDVTEFAPNGDVVMQIDLLNEFYSYRVQKTELPFGMPRPRLFCDAVGQTLSAPEGYDSYYWNTGDTTRSIFVTAPGNYQVWVNQGIGYISSLELTVTDPGQLCLALDQVAPGLEAVRIFPNPVVDELHVEFEAAGTAAWELEIRDVLGRRMLSDAGKGNAKRQYALSGWNSGVYILELRKGKRSFKQKIVHP